MEDTDASDREPWRTDSEGDDAKSCGESESLSDIGDAEVESYLNNEKEKHYKKIIWEKLNQKYLQEQEVKKIAGSANTAKPKKDHRRKQTTGGKKTQSTAEIANPTSTKKRYSSRINYDALSKILGESLPSENSKRRRTESDSDQNSGKGVSETLLDDDEGENEEENGWEDYSYHNNQEEEYNYYDDNEFF